MEERNLEYINASNIIKSYIERNEYNDDLSAEDIKLFVSNFIDKFSPEKLYEIPDDELLVKLFLTENNKENLCYYLEFHKDYICFGSIAGGTSFKFDLYYDKKDNGWYAGSAVKPIRLTNEEALEVGKRLRDKLAKGVELINSKTSLDSVDDYEQLDKELYEILGEHAGKSWVHKYFSIVCLNKLTTWHSADWQSHILFSYNIMPSDNYFVRSGQLALIAKYSGLMMPVFSNVSIKMFGGVKQFYRIGTSESVSNMFDSWKHEGVVAIGFDDIGTLEQFKKDKGVDRELITDKLVEVLYPNNRSTASKKAGELKLFYESNENTIFIAAKGTNLLGLGENVGDYYFDDNKKYKNRKPIQWYNVFNNGEKLPNNKEGLQTSCFKFKDKNNLLYLYNKYIHLEDEGEVSMSTNIYKHSLNQIIYGAPGTGKTYSTAEYALAIIENRPINTSQKDLEERESLMEEYSNYVDNGQIVFTTFHQNYGYEEFVQGIRPINNNGNVVFDKVDGTFKKIADRALEDKESNYVIIIDEINRGNISKIFGELITLIEDDKRYGELNKITVTLPYGDKFVVPSNLYIIGTMNSADKSISLIDTALRRRFSFVEMAPNVNVIQDPILKKLLSEINSYLRNELKSTDLLIGHSFFINQIHDNLDIIMNNNIIPLLYEYFYDDESKIRKALECLKNTNFEIDNEHYGRIRIRRLSND